MQRTLQPSDFKPATEKRREPRTRVRRRIDILPCSAVKHWRFIPCELVDCSLSGLGMTSTEPIQLNQQFLVKLRIKGQIKLLLYTVQNCTKVPDGYRIGATFSGLAANAVDEPRESLLQALIQDDPA